VFSLSAGETDEENTMNWASEIVRAEMDYRVERALGDPRTTLEHRLAAQQAHPSWWRRHRADDSTHHDETGSSRAA
jgi:hypothetical protein